MGEGGAAGASGTASADGGLGGGRAGTGGTAVADSGTLGSVGQGGSMGGEDGGINLVDADTVDGQLYDAGADGSSDGDVGPICGDGVVAGTEECDRGGGNSASAYGKDLCTTACRKAPFCGDGNVNGPETCDSGGAGSTDLGACNPKCSGYFQKKFLRATANMYSGNLSGPQGADAKCQAEFGVGWKALLVGGGRRATVTPNTGDGQLDWVVGKYTYYYNNEDRLVWRTDSAGLLGVSNGQRTNVYADAFSNSDGYPWGGYSDDWVEVAQSNTAGMRGGTCLGWRSDDFAELGTFPVPDLKEGNTEPCGAALRLLCAEQ